MTSSSGVSKSVSSVAINCFGPFFEPLCLRAYQYAPPNTINATATIVKTISTGPVRGSSLGVVPPGTIASSQRGSPFGIPGLHSSGSTGFLGSHASPKSTVALSVFVPFLVTAEMRFFKVHTKSFLLSTVTEYRTKALEPAVYDPIFSPSLAMPSCIVFGVV